MAQVLDDLMIADLSVSDRLDLIGRLWDSLDEMPLAIPDWHREELRKRLESAEQNPDAARPWDEVHQRLLELR